MSTPTQKLWIVKQDIEAGRRPCPVVGIRERLSQMGVLFGILTTGLDLSARRTAVTLAATCVMLAVIAVLFGSSGLAYAQSSQLPEMAPSVEMLEGWTDNTGAFAVSTEGRTFDYAQVAVRHANGDWHSIEQSSQVNNNFWWDDTAVHGEIHSSAYYSRPVRVFLYSGFETLRGNTDGAGHFSVSTGGRSVFHALVAVKHLNGHWHTVERSNQVDNNFWWNSDNDAVQGWIESPNFYGRDVKVIIFERPNGELRLGQNYSAYFIDNANTDSYGHFSHTIDGMNVVSSLVAIRHVNGDWHSLERSSRVDNNFWWNTDNNSVQGWIESPEFRNRDVRIILIVQRGAPVSLLRCKFIDTSPSNTEQYYRDMFFNRGTGGLLDYFAEMTYGRYTMQVTMKGWYTIPMTIEDARRFMDDGSIPLDIRRTTMFNNCVTAARNGDGYVPPPGHVVIVMTAPSVDLWGSPGRVFVSDDPKHGSLVHELLHGFGLPHSFGIFGSALCTPSGWGQPGEYHNAWDIMSWMKTFYSYSVSYIGKYRGVGLNAFHRDLLGWLPADRIEVVAASCTRTVALAALNHPEAAGPLMLKIPVDPSNVGGLPYYTVEFRRKDGWDGPIPNDIVLIHKVQTGADGGPVSWLLMDEFGQPLSTFDDGDISISVRLINSQSNQAWVTVRRNSAEPCRLVALQSDLSEKIVRAGVTNRTYLAAVSDSILGWERFHLISLGGDRIALQSDLNGKIVRAGVTDQTYLAAISDQIAGWETFHLINVGTDKWALKSDLNGKYVRAGVTPLSLLAAVSDQVLGWETFRMISLDPVPIPYQNRVYLPLIGNRMNEPSVKYLSGSTDSNGYFSISTNGVAFDFAVVAVRHVNGDWHTLEASSRVNNSFWWNQDWIRGRIESPVFANRPVRVLLLRGFPLLPTARTDANGHFEVRINGAQFDYALVAVKRNDGNWYTVSDSSRINNNFWRNRDAVMGWIGSPDFGGQDVRVMLLSAGSVGGITISLIRGETLTNGHFSMLTGDAEPYFALTRVQHKNCAWHTIESSNQVDNNFWWNNDNDTVQGWVESDAFYERPVRALLLSPTP